MSNDIIIDFQRESRCGVEEAIYCEGKTPQQIATILHMALDTKARLLLTRLSEEKYLQLDKELQESINYEPIGRTAVLGGFFKTEQNYDVAIVSGGASDASVCKEIEVTLKYHGISCKRFEDVGVAAMWRLTERLPDITLAKIIIAVAGMEAALPTVLSGMVPNPIIAVPTSVGYGVSEGGHLALQSCLGSCAAGLTTVNIDNGFGAACAAVKLMKQFK